MGRCIHARAPGRHAVRPSRPPAIASPLASTRPALRAQKPRNQLQYRVAPSLCAGGRLGKGAGFVGRPDCMNAARASARTWPDMGADRRNAGGGESLAVPNKRNTLAHPGSSSSHGASLPKQLQRLVAGPTFLPARPPSRTAVDSLGLGLQRIPDLISPPKLIRGQTPLRELYMRRSASHR
jgi:hypothetical protein